MPTDSPDPIKHHVVQVGNEIYADSRVLQTASQYGGVVSHLGFGDFAVGIPGATLEFARRDHTGTDDSLRKLGWTWHGRPHLVRSHINAEVAEAWLKEHFGIHTLEVPA